MFRSLLPTALVAALVVCAISASGSGEPENQSTRGPENPIGLIAGKVVDGRTGQPVVEAVVTLYGGGESRGRVMVDDLGRFFFAGLPAGGYQFTVEKFGYMPGAFGRTFPSGSSQALQLTDGQVVTDVSVSMWKFSSISGRVVDEAGEPVAGVSVRVLRRGRTGWALFVGTGGGTDDRGVYRLATLTPGDYAVAVPVRLSTVPVQALREWTPGTSLGLAETAQLGDARNLQIGDHVLVRQMSVPVQPALQPDGRLTVYQTTYHPTTTTADAASVITLDTGDDRMGVDIQLIAVPSASVSGQILGPDGPLAKTSFRLLRASGLTAYDFEPATGYTDASGRFTLLGIPRGQYVVRVMTFETGYVDPSGKPALWASESVSVGGVDVTGLAVVARPAPMFSGRVEVRGERPMPREQFTLIVQAIDPGPFRVVNPDLDREYRFSTPLEPGRYIMAASAPNGAPCPSVMVAGKNIFDEPIEIRDQHITEVLVTCGTDPTRITGTVRDPRGEVDPSARVVAFSVDRRHWSGVTLRPSRLVEARVQTSGVFSLQNLPPGDYFVAAVADAAAANWKDPRTLDVLARSATRVTLAVAESRTMQLRTVAAR